MRRSMLALLASLALLAFPVVGFADSHPADEAPIGGRTSHPHHVHTGNGECVAIDSVLFEADVRGLHQGANASSFNPADGGHEQGPIHGPCEPLE